MDRTHSFCAVAVAALSLALMSSADAALLRSTIGVTENSNSHPQKVKDAVFGPLADSDSVAGSGDFAAAETGTGISLIQLPQYPGRTFVNTAPLRTRTEARNDSTATGVTVATAQLRREGAWRFDAPGLNGTPGSFRVTARATWEQFVSVGDTSAFSVAFGANGVFHGLGNKTLRPTSESPVVSDKDTVFWTSEPLPLTFGQPQNIYWLLSNAGAGASNANHRATTAAEMDLWNVEVFDAAGNKLTRFSQYEWYELGVSAGELSLTEATEYAVATASMVPEPSTLSLLVLAGVPLMRLRRRGPARANSQRIDCTPAMHSWSAPALKVHTFVMLGVLLLPHSAAKAELSWGVRSTIPTTVEFWGNGPGSIDSAGLGLAPRGVSAFASASGDQSTAILLQAATTTQSFSTDSRKEESDGLASALFKDSIVIDVPSLAGTVGTLTLRANFAAAASATAEAPANSPTFTEAASATTVGLGITSSFSTGGMLQHHRRNGETIVSSGFEFLQHITVEYRFGAAISLRGDVQSVSGSSTSGPAGVAAARGHAALSVGGLRVFDAAGNEVPLVNATSSADMVPLSVGTGTISSAEGFNYLLPPAEVPEPASITLLAVPALVLGRRRR